MTIPAGYFKCAEGDYYSLYQEVGEGIEEIQRNEVPSSKFIEGGKLYIRCGERVYDAHGQLISDNK